MTRKSSEDGSRGPARSNDVRRARLDETDHVLLAQLTRDARTPNNALAEMAGIAPSTCLARVRSLVERGVIRGFHADVDPAALGRDLEAMISVRLRADARPHMAQFAERMSIVPEVLDVYFIAGADDYLLHVAMRDTAALRDFVLDHLSARPEVAATETILVFEHIRPRSGS
ncbi:Lrp/AsnC family transcriptional regulator [Rhodococcus spelaei]|uniref:Lrp/AsnC family transcriptional regulator n=1 Tax=Rhodococcus spelaei TaxID=2546320 RepID=A0A541BQE9_9NOCA|nr:Lrp/AsnC family transcriptional regulator [Rhodococcus spelaei]TQF74567.1 Lrp/AsnC family transcriptional regulator [Rhodococcus spelaei]